MRWTIPLKLIPVRLPKVKSSLLLSLLRHPTRHRHHLHRSLLHQGLLRQSLLHRGLLHRGLLHRGLLRQSLLHQGLPIIILLNQIPVLPITHLQTMKIREAAQLMAKADKVAQPPAPLPLPPLSAARILVMKTTANW